MTKSVVLPSPSPKRPYTSPPLSAFTGTWGVCRGPSRKKIKGQTNINETYVPSDRVLTCDYIEIQ